MCLCNHLKEYGTPLPRLCAPFDQPKILNGHRTRTSKAVQMTQFLVNVLIFGMSIFNPFHKSKIQIKLIGVNIGAHCGDEHRHIHVGT